MKKIDARRKYFGERAALARWQNSLKRKWKRRVVKRFGVREEYSGWYEIVAPKKIDIYSLQDGGPAFIETMNFIDDIERNFGRGNCYLSFKSTEAITAAALVVVYAAVDVARKRRAGKVGKAEIIWSEKAENVNGIIRNYNLHKMILGEHLDYKLDDVRIMPVMSGVGNECMDEIVDFIQKKIYRDRMTPDTEYVYGDAVSETIYNVGLHAYPNLNAADKRWWLFCRAKGKMLHLAIYDRGVGIPKTVVDNPWFVGSLKIRHPKEYAQLLEQFPELKTSRLMGFLPTIMSDEKLIYMSMQGDVSGTNKDRHGQGSKSIMALVNETPGGLLWVFSNGGLCKFKEAELEPEAMELPVKFPGTLIQWNIELP